MKKPEPAGYDITMEQLEGYIRQRKAYEGKCAKFKKLRRVFFFISGAGLIATAIFLVFSQTSGDSVFYYPFYVSLGICLVSLCVGIYFNAGRVKKDSYVNEMLESNCMRYVEALNKYKRRILETDEILDAATEGKD